MARLFAAVVCLLACAPSSPGQPFILLSGHWDITHGASGHCEGDGFGLSCPFQVGSGGGSARLAPYSPFMFNPYPAYQNLPSVKISGGGGYQGGFSGPPLDIPYLISGVTNFSVNQPIPCPLIHGQASVYSLGAFGVDTLLVRATLTDSDGHTLFTQTATGDQFAGFSQLAFVDALSPASYTLTTTFSGILHLGDSQGHTRLAFGSYEVWLVVPAPGSGAIIALAVSAPLVRRRR